MKVDLLYNTPLWVVDKAISKCWDKGCDISKPNLERIDRVANKNKHESTIEHLVYTFEIQDISRALLQELARHRLASYSVKSTRYTLKELMNTDNVSQFLVPVNSVIDKYNIDVLTNIQKLLRDNVSNDIIKYTLPEAYKTELVMTINARSLRNLLKLRSSKSALWEFRMLSHNLYIKIPDDHKFLFEDYIDKESK